MSDSNAYLSSASSTESCDTSDSSSWEEMEVAITKENPVVSHEDFASGVYVQIRTENARCLMFSLLRLCFVFYGETNVKNR